MCIVVVTAEVPYYRAPERSPRSSLDLPVPAGYKELTDLCLCPLFCHLPGWPGSMCFCLGKIDFHLASVYSRTCVHSAGEGDRCRSKRWGSEVYNAKVINLIKSPCPLDAKASVGLTPFAVCWLLLNSGVFDQRQGPAVKAISLSGTLGLCPKTSFGLF